MSRLKNWGRKRKSDELGAHRPHVVVYGDVSSCCVCESEVGGVLLFKIFIYLFIIILAAPGLSCGMWDLVP